jgi:hypothetical protein
MKRAVPIILLTACLVAAGCGGGTRPAATTRSTATLTTADPTAQLRQAVTRALAQSDQASLYVLWHDQVPGWAAQSTAGPALASMSQAAAHRRQGGIQVKVLSASTQIGSIEIDPSYLSAEAIVTERSRVVPYRGGRSLGHAVSLVEHARIELRREGSAIRFVVWKVTPTT